MKVIKHNNPKGVFSDNFQPYKNLEVDFFEYENSVATYIGFKGRETIIVFIRMNKTDNFAAKEIIEDWKFNSIKLKIN